MWKRINDKYLRNPKPLPFQRVYGLDGKKWPRIVVHVWAGYIVGSMMFGGRDNIAISISFKRRVGEWWQDSRAIPPEIFEDVIDLLNEFAKSGHEENPRTT